MRRFLRWSLAILAVAALGVAIGARVAPMDPQEWHVDPLSAARTGTPNDYLLAPQGAAAAPADGAAPAYALPAADLMAALDRVALASPRTTRLAGGSASLRVTWIAHSRVFGFPDVVSARAIPLGENAAALAIFARARFGRSDFGVNRARVSAWLRALEEFEQQ